MLDAGYSMLDARCWMLDAGFSNSKEQIPNPKKDAGYWMLDAAC
jgi:hypothetical protein